MPATACPHGRQWCRPINNFRRVVRFLIHDLRFQRAQKTRGEKAGDGPGQGAALQKGKTCTAALAFDVTGA